MPPVQRGDGKKRHTHTHSLTQGNMYVLLLQITTCTSRHSSENTQYYANRRLCDSGAAVGVGHTAPLTADQFTYIPRASLSAACLPLFPNIWLPRCRFVSPTLFHCLNSLFICPPSTSHYSAFFSKKQITFFNLSVYLSFSTPQSLSQHETGHPVSRICSAVRPLTLLVLPSSNVCVWPSCRSWRAAISETKPSAQTDKTRSQSDLWTFELSNDLKMHRASQNNHSWEKLLGKREMRQERVLMAKKTCTFLVEYVNIHIFYTLFCLFYIITHLCGLSSPVWQ